MRISRVSIILGSVLAFLVFILLGYRLNEHYELGDTASG